MPFFAISPFSSAAFDPASGLPVPDISPWAFGLILWLGLLLFVGLGKLLSLLLQGEHYLASRRETWLYQLHRAARDARVLRRRVTRTNAAVPEVLFSLSLGRQWMLLRLVMRLFRIQRGTRVSR